MSSEPQVKNILIKSFPEEHTKAALGYFSEAVKSYQGTDWEGCLTRTGKFVEAVLKALLIHCGRAVPRSRAFKVGDVVTTLSNISVGQYGDSVRLTIPRACTLLYDIASNRGARHDSGEIDANKMDAAMAIPVMSWVLAEMVRVAEIGAKTPQEAVAIVDSLLEKKYPYFENIDDRIYVDFEKLGAQNTGLLLLNVIYPHRMNRQELVKSIQRHDYSRNAAAIAVSRLQRLVDDDGSGNWKLRGVGRRKADSLLSAFPLS